MYVITHYIRPWRFQNFQDFFCPRSSTCLPNTELRMEEVELLVKLRINENSFGLAAEAY